jgi:hypothetical protein
VSNLSINMLFVAQLTQHVRLYNFG